MDVPKEIATWEGGESNWGPMFVQYLRVNSYGPLECHLIQISNEGKVIRFLKKVFAKMVSHRIFAKIAPFLALIRVHGK